MAKKKAVKRKGPKKKVAKPRKKKAPKKKVTKKPPAKKTKGIARRGRPDTPLRHAKLTELAISMFRTRMPEGLTLTYISSSFRMSRWHLSRIFAEQKGEPFSRFATRERLEAAKRLLRDVTLKVSDVAHECGFTNHDYFSTWFRRHEKRTPTAYRARVLTHILRK